MAGSLEIYSFPSLQISSWRSTVHLLLNGDMPYITLFRNRDHSRLETKSSSFCNVLIVDSSASYPTKSAERAQALLAGDTSNIIMLVSCKEFPCIWTSRYAGMLTSAPSLSLPSLLSAADEAASAPCPLGTGAGKGPDSVFHELSCGSGFFDWALINAATLTDLIQVVSLAPRPTESGDGAARTAISS